jgi:dolichol-phosphate mannosyltransferase
MKSVVVIPTYNEHENILPLVERLTALPLELDLFFVDDGSPDHTGDLLESLRPRYPQLHVLHRHGKLGLGTAYRHAFHVLLEEPYDRFLSMDADLSHSPEAIPALVRATDHADLSIGSRYLPGGGTKNCTVLRRGLSRTANGLARGLLGLTIQDATAGFRCYRRDLIAALDRIDVRSNGYSFLVEMTYFSQAMGFRICEVPILFEDRVRAKSKMSRMEIARASMTLMRLWLHRVSGGGARDRMRLAGEGLGPVIRKPPVAPDLRR